MHVSACCGVFFFFKLQHNLLGTVIVIYFSFPPAVTQRHAAVQQSSCLCSSSTPCVTKQRILATSATTALCCQRLAQFFEWSWYSWLGQMHLKLGNTIVLMDCFPSLCLGPCCTCPLCCLGRGRFREGVWSTQSAQDWLWSGGPPHTSESRGEPFLCTVLLWRTEYDVQVTLCLVKPFPLLPVHQKLDFVDVATGSLGQGLGAACGMAYTGKNFDKSRLVCLKTIWIHYLKLVCGNQQHLL